MAEINLLKDSTQARKSFSMEGPGKSIALYITGGLLVLELLLYGGLFWYEGNLEGQIAAADLAAADVDLEISKTSAERQEATSYQNRLQNLETVLGNHLLWTAFMAELERVSLKSAVYTDILYTPGETEIFLSGRIPSYTDLAKLLVGLEGSPYFSNPVLESSGIKGAEEGGYAFVMFMTFDPEILLKK